MNPDALFPYERPCPDCGGEKPLCWPGEGCDGAGVVYADRREVDNGYLRKILDEIDAIHRETVARLVRQLFKEREEAEAERVRLEKALERATRIARGEWR